MNTGRRIDAAGAQLLRPSAAAPLEIHDGTTTAAFLQRHVHLPRGLGRDHMLRPRAVHDGRRGVNQVETLLAPVRLADHRSRVTPLSSWTIASRRR
jgi:hypothetical protein